MISCNNVVKTFNNLEVLKGIDLDVASGEVVVIIGPSGSGKSTFLRCMNCLEVADSGTITINGKIVDSKESSLNNLRQDIGMVFQQFNLFPHMNRNREYRGSTCFVKKNDKRSGEEKGHGAS